MCLRHACTLFPQILPTAGAVHGTFSVTCEVATEYHTGVEMEALTGASVAALCVYDMCKALSHDIVITSTRLLHKSGGKRSVGEPLPSRGGGGSR